MPLLQGNVVPTGLASNDTFLSGYVAAHTKPGPLFTSASLLGAAMRSPYAVGCRGVIFLPAIVLLFFLLTAGALLYYASLLLGTGIQRLIGGINAAALVFSAPRSMTFCGQALSRRKLILFNSRCVRSTSVEQNRASSTGSFTAI